MYIDTWTIEKYLLFLVPNEGRNDKENSKHGITGDISFQPNPDNIYSAHPLSVLLSGFKLLMSHNFRIIYRSHCKSHWTRIPAVDSFVILIKSNICFSVSW